jgi:hypothetical protein
VTLVSVVLPVSLVSLSLQILYVPGMWLLPLVEDKTPTFGSFTMTQASYQVFFFKLISFVCILLGISPASDQFVRNLKEV